MQFEPGKIYICLAHPHPGHFYAAPHGATIQWRFYNRYNQTWFNQRPESGCELTLFDDPRQGQ